MSEVDDIKKEIKKANQKLSTIDSNLNRAMSMLREIQTTLRARG